MKVVGCSFVLFTVFIVFNNIAHGQDYAAADEEDTTKDGTEYDDESSTIATMMSPIEEMVTVKIMNMLPPVKGRPIYTMYNVNKFERPVFKNNSALNPSPATATGSRGRPNKPGQNTHDKNERPGKDKFEMVEKHSSGKNKPGNMDDRGHGPPNRGKNEKNENHGSGKEKKGNQDENDDKPIRGKPPTKGRDNDRFTEEEPTRSKGHGNNNHNGDSKLQAKQNGHEISKPVRREREDNDRFTAEAQNQGKGRASQSNDGNQNNNHNGDSKPHGKQNEQQIGKPHGKGRDDNDRLMDEAPGQGKGRDNQSNHGNQNNNHNGDSKPHGKQNGQEIGKPQGRDDNGRLMDEAPSQGKGRDNQSSHGNQNNNNNRNNKEKHSDDD